jgi:hypothetical protein
VGAASLTVSVSVAVRLTPLPRVTDSEKVRVPGAVRENACDPRVRFSEKVIVSVALRDAPLPPTIVPTDSENVIVSEVARARAVERATLSASVTLSVTVLAAPRVRASDSENVIASLIALISASTRASDSLKVTLSVAVLTAASDARASDSAKSARRRRGA